MQQLRVLNFRETRFSVCFKAFWNIFFFQMRLTEAFHRAGIAGMHKKKIETGKKAKPEATVFWTLPKLFDFPQMDDYNMKCMTESYKKKWSFFDTLLLSVHFGS